MKLNINLNIGFRYTAIAMGALLIACQPDEIEEGNGLVATELDAGFTITDVADANNTYVLTANGSYLTSSWDLGKGIGFVSGGTEETVFYPDAGTYTIQHKVTGIGGVSKTAIQTIDIESSDPVAGNLVRGGKFENENDHAEWTILNISASGASWTFNENSATITASDYNQQAIYQAIEVVAGREYEIDMFISGDGNDEAWFEVFASTVEPVQWSDYGNDVVMGLNTWTGCGTGTLSDFLSSTGCVANSYSGVVSNTVTFDTSGTVYLVIKCGGGTVPGYTISNVEMRGTGE
ncbi:PKD domain-containing protein [Maribacter thermophilus]|uniref:PKD domain-containing protein n=1 Tax=Maribacter thermophilus TaxID=1197874 RepID=UPI0006414FB4|nr:PKD domain-containing protein [Maribacter thermophilus]